MNTHFKKLILAYKPCSTTWSPLLPFCFLANYLIDNFAFNAFNSAEVNVYAALEDKIPGRLLPGLPFAKPCFPPVDEAACALVRQHYLDGTTRYDKPASAVNVQWETCQRTQEQCLLNWMNVSDITATSSPFTCKQGSVSPAYIDVRTPEDVMHAFNHSKTTGTHLVIHNTGHDYIGRSFAPNSLGLWIHNLKNITLHRNFVPSDCDVKPASAVTMGAGVQWGEAYAFAEANNITIVGGSDKGVGSVGGWLQGGGHSMLSNTLGLGVDRVIEFKVVTPDGHFRIANKCQNPDLFFALRGGGGGTFGVVLEATVLASPQLTLQALRITWSQPDFNLTSDLWKLMIDNAEILARKGFGVTGVATLTTFASPAVTSGEAEKLLAPLIDFGNKIVAEGVPGAQVIFNEYSSFYPYYQEHIAPIGVPNGIPIAVASRLVPHDNFATSQSKSDLHAAMLDIFPNFFILGTSPVNFKHDEGTSVTEAWRKTVWHVLNSKLWNYDTTLEEKKAIYSQVSKSVDKLRAITPPAAYGNEADVYEPDHEVAFWGSHYPDLLRIKKKYDPDHLLDCWHCVGWNPHSARYSCYV
ncbi:oxygen-dependent FAD-linked oxidoreductase family protein [Abortiporus biennis]